MESKNLVSIAKIEQLVASSGFADVFAASNPYDAGFPAALSCLLDSAGKDLYREIVSVLSDCDALTAYRNVIAVSTGSPFHLSAITRSTLSSDIGEVRALHAPLSTVLKKQSKADPGLCWIYDPDNEGKPSIPTSCHFTPSLRLRYSLAGKFRQRIRVESWVKEFLKHPGCSRLAGQREFRRAIRESEEAGVTLVPLSVARLSGMPMALQMLVSSDSVLSKSFISSKANLPEIKANVEQSWKVRMDARRKLIQISKLIADRQFRKAEKISITLPVNAIDAPLRKEFSKVVLKRIDAPNRAAMDVPWHPMGSRLKRVLWILTGKRFSSSVLTFTVEEIVSKASKTKLYPKKISKIDLARLKRRITRSDLLLLASAGRFDLAEAISERAALPYLEQLSDSYYSHEAAHNLLEILVSDHSLQCAKQALPYLQVEDAPALRQCIKFCDQEDSKKIWRKSLLPYLGTQAAREVLMPDSDTILEAFKLSRSRKLIVNIEAFHSQLSSWLYQLLCFEITGQWEGPALPYGYQELRDLDLKTALEYAKTYHKINPDFVQVLADRLSVENVSRLIAEFGLNDQFVSLIEKHVRDEGAKSQLRRIRLRLAEKPGKFLSEIKRDPEFVGMLTPDLLQSLEFGVDADSRAFHIICLRRSPRKLQLYLRRLDWRSSKASLLKAAGFLEPSSRDRGYLELVATLGPMHVRTIAAALARIDSGKPAGHKLDRDYRTYKLPKKSGGNRTVSVPSSVLKRVQRGVLYSILNPLGSHEASYGFVKGRSIRDNAEQHVGQEVVVNCDVSNCFPNVSWSLVLGAVRRDLGELLSPAAISLIVDICTARGGLPIGAPTSPLLLNRVLLRTDEVLTRASEDRGCTYTRYADDLTFSGNGRAVELLGVAKGTLTRIGLELDPKKTNIFRRGRRQVVNGLSVNELVNVPRRIRRRLRSALHSAEQGEGMHWHGKKMNMSSLRGRISFVNSINPDSAKSMLARLQCIEKKIDG